MLKTPLTLHLFNDSTIQRGNDYNVAFLMQTEHRERFPSHLNSKTPLFYCPPGNSLLVSLENFASVPFSILCFFSDAF